MNYKCICFLQKKQKIGSFSLMVLWRRIFCVDFLKKVVSLLKVIKKEKIMNTIEFDIRKANRYTLQGKSEKKKMMDDFWAFIDKVRQPTANYKFNRQESYD